MNKLSSCLVAVSVSALLWSAAAAAQVIKEPADPLDALAISDDAAVASRGDRTAAALATCNGVRLSTILCLDGPHPAQPVELYLDGELKHTWSAIYCGSDQDWHSYCLENATDVDLRSVRLVVPEWTSHPGPNPPNPPWDAVRWVSIGGIYKNRGAQPRYIPMNGLAASATLPAFPVYKVGAGKGDNTAGATCMPPGSSLPPTNQGFHALARLLCDRSWGCTPEHFVECGDYGYVDFGNNP